MSDKVVVFSRRPTRRDRDPHLLPYPRNQQIRFTSAFTKAERLASEALGVVPPAETGSAA